MRSSTVSALILAAGKSSRMIINHQQVDKAWVDWQGKPLIEHVQTRLSAQVKRLAINAPQTSEARQPYERLSVPLLHDSHAGHQGPIAGVLAGLIHCRLNRQNTWLQICPCDAPLVPRSLVQQLSDFSIGELDLNTSIQIRVPVDQTNQAQPTFAQLHITALEPLQAYFNGGGRSLLEFANQGKTAWVPFEESAEDNFANINSSADLVDYLRISNSPGNEAK